MQSKSGDLDSNQFRDILISRLPDHMKYIFSALAKNCPMISC